MDPSVAISNYSNTPVSQDNVQQVAGLQQQHSNMPHQALPSTFYHQNQYEQQTKNKEKDKAYATLQSPTTAPPACHDKMLKEVDAADRQDGNFKFAPQKIEHSVNFHHQHTIHIKQEVSVAPKPLEPYNQHYRSTGTSEEYQASMMRHKQPAGDGQYPNSYYFQFPTSSRGGQQRKPSSSSFSPSTAGEHQYPVTREESLTATPDGRYITTKIKQEGKSNKHFFYLGYSD